ncbi:hypothetical protein [Streptomyces californicus]|uniref:hypothetical protein n=1 Tax=Streptomyces californicus TaxID=67351 RepID=UPI00296F7171|nr:hypothetical protein [Streptomyces californicus]MDW4912535.1 hypothetical protein [Streptomyces californicus]
MTTHNPTLHLRQSADALDRLLRELNTGTAAWQHTRLAATSTHELGRIAAALPAVTELLAAALHTHAGPRADTAAGALSQATTTARELAAHLHRARTHAQALR